MRYATTSAKDRREIPEQTVRAQRLNYGWRCACLPKYRGAARIRRQIVPKADGEGRAKAAKP